MVWILTLEDFFMFSPQCWWMASSVFFHPLFCFARHLHLRKPFCFAFFSYKWHGKQKKTSPKRPLLCFLATEHPSWLILSSIHLDSLASLALPCGDVVELRFNTNTRTVSLCLHRRLWTWFILFTPQYVRVVPLWNGASSGVISAKRS